MKKNLPLLTRLYLRRWKSKALFTLEQYSQILNTLSENKFIAVPLNDFRNLHDPRRVIVGMRKDVDNDPYSALKLAAVDYSHGIRSSYFILSTARYAGKISQKKGLSGIKLMMFILR